MKTIFSTVFFSIIHFEFRVLLTLPCCSFFSRSLTLTRNVTHNRKIVEEKHCELWTEQQPLLRRQEQRSWRSWKWRKNGNFPFSFFFLFLWISSISQHEALEIYVTTNVAIHFQLFRLLLFHHLLQFNYSNRSIEEKFRFSKEAD